MAGLDDPEVSSDQNSYMIQWFVLSADVPSGEYRSHGIALSKMRGFSFFPLDAGGKRSGLCGVLGQRYFSLVVTAA